MKTYKYLVIDVETTISNKGNPFDETNKLCYIGLLNSTSHIINIEYDNEPYGDKLNEVQKEIDNSEILVGFNIKFDLHWIRKYRLNFMDKRIWDCQLVHFILTGQQNPYPSLNSVAEYYGLGSKLDVVATEYWANKIDTPNIPKDILENYLEQDLNLTKQIYFKQLEELKQNPNLIKLISLHNQDLLVLQEMEFNGLLFNEEKSNELANQTEQEVNRLDEFLFQFHNCPGFNPSSNDHLSAFLYGGFISLRRRVACGVFKTGSKSGQVKERWEEYQVEFPRLFTPLKGSELQKEGFWSTDEATLKSLKGSWKAREAREILLFRSTLEKRLTTYYRGLTNLIKEMNWETNVLHGQLNQCVARTGRLSSSKPNLQNFDGEIKQLFGSRYAITS
jgi:DNA polymerase I-like protein with 3'-5' exonuclease and polymerase domains